MSFARRALPHSSVAHTFPSLCFASDIPLEALVALQVSYQIQLQISFSKPILACFSDVTVFCLVFCPCSHFLHASLLCLSLLGSFFCIHAGLWPPLLLFPFAITDHSWAWRRRQSKVNRISKTMFYGILPGRSLSRPKPAVLDSCTVSPDFFLFPSFQEPNLRHLMVIVAELQIPQQFLLVCKNQVQ